jgi:ketosteroid isomerase-like protein
MSQENVKLVRDQYAAVNERDFDRARAGYDEDAELFVVGGIRSGTFRGRDEVARWFADWFSTFDSDAHFDITELTELEDGSILVVADHRARGRSSGVEVHGSVVWRYLIHDGKITRQEGYPTREEALEAAGLSE